MAMVLAWCMTRNVQAAVTSWIGGGANANWNTAANWVGGDLNVPMVVMIYDQGFSGWNPTTNYMAQGNIPMQAAVQAGQAAGIIQYKLDKSDTSPAFPIIAQLYGQWAYQPQFASINRAPDGNISLAGDGGGPNIGYTLKAADTMSTSVASWGTVAMGNFDTNGHFVATDTGAVGRTSRFYRISVP